MKKRNNLLILALFAALVQPSVAQERSSAEKLSIVCRVLDMPATRAGETLQELDRQSMVTVVGGSRGERVVVSNDARFPEVLGYTLQADGDNAPAAYKAWMEAINAAMESMAERGDISQISAPDPSKYAAAVEPLVTTTWDQGMPYNTLCPSGNGSTLTLYPTGCVATALAQIMNYHQYPAQGIGTHTYSFSPSTGQGRLLTANFGETTYDWANMLDSYSAGSYDEVQANAVAVLMAQLGVAVDMGYTASGSGAYGVEAAQGIRTYFGYNENADLFSRDYYSEREWMNLIYREINLKRPIYYAGVDSRQGGHAFVLDGYDETGLVHINWGWGGSNNGYYNIALLNPGSYSFSLSQDMILGMARPEEEVEYSSKLVVYNGELSFMSPGSNVTVSSTVYNVSSNKFSGKLAVVAQSDEDGSQTVLKEQADAVDINPFLGGRGYGATASVTSARLARIPADGSYHVFLASKDSKDTRWQLVRGEEGKTNSLHVVKSGSTYTKTPETDDAWATAISAVVVEKEVSSDANYYDLSGRRIATPHRPGIYIRQGKKVVVK